jgi:transposase-like protein
MTARDTVNAAGFLREHLETASPDLLRSMVKTFAETLMSADADAARGAGYGSAARSGSTPATATATGSGMPASASRSSASHHS